MRNILLLISLMLLACSPEPRADGLLVHSVKQETFPVVAPIAGPMEQGKPVLQPETSLTLRRITDVADFSRMHAGPPKDVPTEAWEPYKNIDWCVGNPEFGNTNGYSKFSALNITGEYMLVFLPNALVGLYRVADCKYLGEIASSASRGIGENPNDVRWDVSGRPGTETMLYYTWDGTLYQQDALKGFSSRKTLDVPKAGGEKLIYSGGEGDFDFSGRYFAMKFGHYDDTVKRNVNVRCAVYDFQEMKLLPGYVPEDTNGLDMSPSGKWMALLGHAGAAGKANCFYRVADLQSSGTLKPVSVDSAEKWNSDVNGQGQSIGHNGWAYDQDGNEVLVYQDNVDDWMKAFDPEKGKSFNIYYMGWWGWDGGFHIGSMKNPALKGWMFYSSYENKPEQDGTARWDENQMMMIEVKPWDEADPPRIWRLASTQNLWRSYMSEAWAAIDPRGRHIIWAANRGATTNLETYIMDLPADWPQRLAKPGK